MTRNKEEKLITSVISLFLFILSFSLLYGFSLEQQNKIEKTQKQKEIIEECIKVLTKDCQQKCPTFIENEVLFVNKECKGKELKNAWISMSQVKAYYENNKIKWF
ncbi:MAG: hypothetical protein QW228_07505 [Candidatus Aenigmatarchaeota archaeon]